MSNDQVHKTSSKLIVDQVFVVNTECSFEAISPPLPGVKVCLRGTIPPPEPWRRPCVAGEKFPDLGAVELPRWAVNPAISRAKAVIRLPDHPSIGGTTSRRTKLFT
ncbi:MAG: hypothetical protein ACFFB3_09085 [Candidatus Hodarchaeota archaeon]